MQVLVTGATGFVGSYLTRILVREKCAVYVLIRRTSDRWRLKDILGSLNVINCDLTRQDALKMVIKEVCPDVCFHLAWKATPGKYLGSTDSLSMLFASAHLASQLADNGCKRFIGVGTCFEYDVQRPGYLSEDSPTSPRGLYGASKLAAFHILGELSRAAGMDFTWLRLFYLYGPFEDNRRLVPYIICSLLRNEEARITSGDQVRDYLHVEDVADAIWAVFKHRITGAVNVGSGNPLPIKEIASIIGQTIGKPLLIRMGGLPKPDSDPSFICANSSLLRLKTGWAPKYDIEQGLHQTIEWWKTHIKECHLSQQHSD